MKRVIAALFGTVTGLVVLLNFKTHPASVASGIAPAATAPADTSTSATAAPSTPNPASPSASTSTSSGGSKSYTGDSADTRWGPVQVKITVTNGKVTSAQAIDYPQNNPRDQEINSYAIPALNQEAVTAGSAKIDTVSGATYTSDGYVRSLQSALDKAGL